MLDGRLHPYTGKRADFHFCRKFPKVVWLSHDGDQPTKKDSGMDTNPGEESGKIAQSAPGNMEVSEPETAGEKKMSTKQDTTPVYMEATAPAVLNRRQ